MIRRLAIFALVALAACGQSAGGQTANQQQPAQQARDSGRRATALFAGGCFWSTESAMEHVPGVVAAVSGFAGGSSANPTYEQVTGGNTGHREAVRVTYDPTRISYGTLVRRFLRTIDPTDDGGQACDRGANYRSAVFALNPAQRREAQAALAEANRILGGRVVTPLLDAAPFYAAAEHHQDYARLNPGRYGLYRRGCGRDGRLRQVWGNQAYTP
jgi:peptide-methionine (S)-S-oxide reductase